MQGKRLFLFLCLLVVLTSCPPEDECLDPPFVEMEVSGSDSNVLKTYLYAYGEGMEMQKIFPGYYKVYRYDSVNHAYIQYVDSNRTMFSVELDMNSNSSGFCLVKKDLSIDTVTLGYKRIFYAHERCDGFSFDEVVIKRLSAGFIRDSCFVSHTPEHVFYIMLKK